VSHPPRGYWNPQTVLRATVLAVVYVLVAKLGLALAFGHPSATAIWPAAGIALAAAVMFGGRVWPGIFVGAFVTNVTTLGSVFSSLCIATGNTFEAVLGGYLLHRIFLGQPTFTRGRDILVIALVTSACTAPISATIGVTSLSLLGFAQWPDYGSIWLTWWLGDTAGVVVLAPTILLWNMNSRLSESRVERIELGVMLLVVIGVGIVVFTGAAYPLTFLCLPACLWAGLRFGPREAATAACMLSVMAVWGSARGLGAFGQSPPHESLLFVASFMSLTAIIGTTIGASEFGRRLAEKQIRLMGDHLEEQVRQRTRQLQIALDRLAASERGLAEAQEVAHVGSWEWRVADGKAKWSDELLKIYSIDRASGPATYDELVDLTVPGDREALRDIVASALNDGVPFTCEHRITRDGRERTLDTRGRVIRDASGRVEKLVGTTQDITEFRTLELERRRGHKMEAIGLLAGGIAHDFNNVLTAIIGYTEFVLETVADQHRADLLEIRKAAERAAALTKQLLTVAKRQVLQTKAVDLNVLVGDVHKLLRRAIPEDVDIVLEFDPVLDSIRVDPGQLEQVLLNLAVNARDAMPNGGQLRLATDMADVDTVWAHAHPPMTPGRYVRLTVSDTGVGMSAETQSRVFEPFFTTKPAGHGTGLGLATVYGIVKQSAGFIWVTSELGRGTAFEIYLPPAQARLNVASPEAPQLAPEGGSETILIAEDDGAVLRLAGDVLRRYGYTVLQARDGAEALSIVQQHTGIIHLLVTDVVMPGLSGRDLAERVAIICPAIRVLYSSGYIPSTIKGVTGHDGRALLPKPYPPLTLVRTVREVLDAPGYFRQDRTA
jgi:two-component system, cell cycle sensor histidine kinase and response regulator CckA